MLVKHTLYLSAYSITVGVGDHIAGMALHKVRLNEKACLAATGAAYHQHIFVSGSSGVFGAIIHGQTFRLGQENIFGEHRVDIGHDVFLRSP